MKPFTAVSVIGPSPCTAEEARLAEEVGRLLAENGAAVICGGLGGIMEAVCRGASQEGGLTIGLLPGTDPMEANPYVQVPIATGAGEMRNVFVARAGSAVIAVGGGYGTLTEIGFALLAGKRVVGIDTWRLSKKETGPFGIEEAPSPEHAVRLALGPA